MVASFLNELSVSGQQDPPEKLARKTELGRVWHRNLFYINCVHTVFSASFNQKVQEQFFFFFKHMLRYPGEAFFLSEASDISEGPDARNCLKLDCPG